MAFKSVVGDADSRYGWTAPRRRQYSCPSAGHDDIVAAEGREVP